MILEYNRMRTELQLANLEKIAAQIELEKSRNHDLNRNYRYDSLQNSNIYI